MDFQRELKRYRPYFPLVFLVIAFLVGYFLAKPAVFTLLSQRKQGQKNANLLQDQKEDLQILQEVERRYKEEMGELQKSDKILPNKKNLTQVLYQVEKMAAENGLIVAGIGLGGSTEEKESLSSEDLSTNSSLDNFDEPADPGPEVETQGVTTKKQTVEKFTVNIDLVGSYQNLKLFLKNVEKNLRLMDIVGFNFTSPQEGETMYGFNLTAHLYYYQ